MTRTSGSSDLETRLTAALTDTARRNLSAAAPPPAFQQPLDSAPTGRIRNWALPVLAAAVVVAVAVALLLPNRGHYSSVPPAHGPGTLITLRARTDGLSSADLRKARQIISARAMALGATNPDVRIVGPDEIAAFLPGVAAGEVGALGTVDAFQVRPFIVDWTLAKSPPVPSGRAPKVVDQWKSLGFAPPKDAAAFRALSQARQNALRAMINHWDCNNLPLDRADVPIVACDPRGNKYLLGATIISGKDVQSSAVVPLAPRLAQRHAEVSVVLSAAGQRRWTDYVAQHNDTVHPLDIANEIADLLDDVVGHVYTVRATVSGDTSIENDLTDQKVDATLAANLTGGPLPAPFDVVSIQSR